MSTLASLIDDSVWKCVLKPDWKSGTFLQSFLYCGHPDTLSWWAVLPQILEAFWVRLSGGGF